MVHIIVSNNLFQQEIAIKATKILDNLDFLKDQNLLEVII